MLNIAVLGYGVVGSGVVEVLDRNAAAIEKRAGKAIKVKKILDIRDFDESPYKDLFTKNFDDILNDESIKIVVETIGVLKVSYEYTKKALEAGKHVVTSNKELVATYGPELLKIAAEKKVHYLFEASVGGGIPIIRPLTQCLAANEIEGMIGILNGTTNYILTQMKREGKDFNEALKEAQQKGYAEANPTADIEGYDTCRKIAILSSIAYDKFVDYKEVSTEGISNISTVDIEYADALGCTIKLAASSKCVNGKIFARVCPVLINNSSPLANVEDEFNAIVVKGNAVGDVMFCGKGAGKLPTASAVVADIIDIATQSGYKTRYLWEREQKSSVENIVESDTRLFIRAEVQDSEEAKKAVNEIFGNVQYISLNRPALSNEIAFSTERDVEKNLMHKVDVLKDSGKIKGIKNIIRFEE